MLGFIITASLSLIALIFGVLSATWRRACVYITREAKPAYVLEKFGAGKTAELIHNPRLSKTDLDIFTPSWVKFRIKITLLFLLLATISAIISFNLWVGLLIAVLIYILIELLSFVFPKMNNPYYLFQILDTINMKLDIAKRIGDNELKEEMEYRLNALEIAFSEYFELYYEKYDKKESP
ncbi:MAG: hypothetical protein ACFCU6_12475 [Balneolaceae bacterium]